MKKQQHGLRYHPLYLVWCAMKQRCSNPNRKDFKRYGGRGVKVCNLWQKDPKSFIEWCLANGYKKGLQLDRIDNDGNYEPCNCRFVTNATNSRKQTTNKLNWETVTEIRETIKSGERITHQELANRYSVSQALITDIINNKIWKEKL